MDYSLLGSSVHGILQARILEWVVISFSRGSSQHRDWTRVSHTVGRLFTIGAARGSWHKCWPYPIVYYGNRLISEDHIALWKWNNKHGGTCQMDEGIALTPLVPTGVTSLFFDHSRKEMQFSHHLHTQGELGVDILTNCFINNKSIHLKFCFLHSFFFMLCRLHEVLIWSEK